MLTEKQEEFCRRYVASSNALRAAAEAGYRKVGLERRVTRLLTDQRIRDRILALGGSVSHMSDLTPERVVEELLAIGTFDLRCLFDETGVLRNISELDARAARAISSIEITTKVKSDGETETIHKVKTCSKEKALELLGKHLGMWGSPVGEGEGETEEDDAASLARAWDRVRAGTAPDGPKVGLTAEVSA